MSAVEPLDPGSAGRAERLAEARRRGASREGGARRARADLLRALPLVAVGLLGTLPAPREPETLALLAWLALWSPVAGWLAGAGGLRAVGAAAVPGAWMLAFVLLEAGALGEDVGRGVASPVGAAAAWSGLFAAGFGLGRAAGRGRTWRGAGLVAAAAALAAGAAIACGLGDAPPPPGWSARALDASPVVLVIESAGVADWMWHPSTYEPAGVDRYARAPYDAELAGPLALLVGCAVAVLGSLLARREPR